MTPFSSVIKKTQSQKGFALIFAITILSIISAFSLYFPLAGRNAMLLAKNYYYGTEARYMAEAGVETVRARLRNRVTRIPLASLRVDSSTPTNGRWADAEDEVAPRGMADRHFSSNDDEVDNDGDGAIDEADEFQPLAAGSNNGFIAAVRDLGRGIDLNLSSPDAALDSTSANNALRYALGRFPTIAEVTGASDTLTAGGIVDDIIDYRNNNLGGRFHSIEELLGVPGMTQAVYDQIKPYVTVHTSNRIVSGGLIAHYYNNITGAPNNVAFDYSSYAGSVIDKGSGGDQIGGSFTFHMNSGVDFEGAQVDCVSFGLSSPCAAGTLSRPALLGNDAAPGSPVRATHALTFGVRWEGFIFIPEDRYSSGNSAPMAFRLIASGGARMKIAGIPVVTTDNFWDSDHDGSSGFSSSSSNYFQYEGSLNEFPQGWQPIEIEYWCDNRVPVFLLTWNQGFRFEPGTTNAGADEDADTDMGSSTLAIPSQSLGYKAGGFYEVRSMAQIRNLMGGVEAQKTAVARLQLFDYLHDTLVRDFSQGTFLKGKISLKDSYPVVPPNTEHEFNEEFSRTSAFHNRQYDTALNAVKPGYWAAFDDLGDSTDNAGWVVRNGETTTALTDVDGDGDRELAITSNDDMATDPYIFNFSPTGALAIPAIDLVGTGTLGSPQSDYIYRNFYLRFREYANRGPLDRINNDPGTTDPPPATWKTATEDYDDSDYTKATNFDADSAGVPDGDDRPFPNAAFKKEDVDMNGSILQGPHSYWVGQPLMHRTDAVGADWLIYNEQYYPGPNGSNTQLLRPTAKQHLQYRTNNGTGYIYGPSSNSPWGYNRLGYEWLIVHGNRGAGDEIWFFQNRPLVETGSGQTFRYVDGYLNGLGGNLTIGYRSLGNEAGYPRAIDSVRILPTTPCEPNCTPPSGGVPGGVFTSRNLDAGSNVTWGVATWLKFPTSTYEDSKVRLNFGTGTSSNPAISAALGGLRERGASYIIPSGNDGTRYFRYLLNFFLYQKPGVNVNIDIPFHEEFTVTYLTQPRVFYYREGVEGD